MDALLYGQSPTRKVVAVQQHGDQHIRLYIKNDGKISTTDVEFFPFLYLSDQSLLSGFHQKFWLKELAGSNYFRYLAAFSRWSEYWDAIRVILETTRKQTGTGLSGYAALGTVHTHPDPVWQFLVQSGTTHFRDLEISDLSCLHIELTAISPPGKTPIAAKSSNRIVVIALSDGKGWTKVLDGKKLNEPEMISELAAIINEKDPDLLIGQQLSTESLPYLLRRCALHQLAFPIGRDGSEPRSIALRSPRSSNEPEHPSNEIAGRHLVDLELLANLYEPLRRHSESAPARILLHEYFGMDEFKHHSSWATHRGSFWDEDQEFVRGQTLIEVKASERLASLLLPGLILLSRIVALPPGSLIRTKPNVQLESILIRAYLYHKHALPMPSNEAIALPEDSEMFFSGLFSNVLEIEFPDLHARVIQSLDLSPQRDELNIFHRLLDHILQIRQETASKESHSTPHHFNTRASALDSLLKGFYSHVTSSRGILNDAPMSGRIVEATNQMRTEVQQIAALFNSELILRDGFAHFFSTPDNIVGREKQEQLLERISASLPAGVEPVIGAAYERLLSLKRKNYVTLDAQQRIRIYCPSLLPRGVELYLRRFMEQAIANILNDNIAGLHKLYHSTAEAILHHQWSVTDFERRETLHVSLEEYKKAIEKGDRKPTAVYEALLRSESYASVGESVAFYVTGSGANVKISENVRPSIEWDANFPDENRDFYLMRLREYTRRFDMLFSDEDFQKLFTHDSLFEFDPANIVIVDRRQTGEGPSMKLNKRGTSDDEFRIWIDDRTNDSGLN